jgi:hypothetical protein
MYLFASGGPQPDYLPANGWPNGHVSQVGFCKTNGNDVQDSVGVRLTGTRPPDLCPLLLQFTHGKIEAGKCGKP